MYKKEGNFSSALSKTIANIIIEIFTFCMHETIMRFRVRKAHTK